MVEDDEGWMVKDDEGGMVTDPVGRNGGGNVDGDNQKVVEK